MNIDLLISSQGEIGLVTDAGFESPVAGIMFDAQTHMMNLEFADMNALELNIPVEDSTRDALLYRMSLQVGIIENDQIQDTRSVPLVLINDPMAQTQYQQPAKPHVSVTAFERFLKSCIAGQPVHRDDLGNEDLADGVMSGMNTAVVQFAPHLARQKTMEAAPTLTPNAPGLTMGGGGGGGARTSYAPPKQQDTSRGGQQGHQGGRTRDDSDREE